MSEFIIIVAIFAGFAILYLLLKSRLDTPKSDPALTEWMKSIQQSFDNSSRLSQVSTQQNYRELFSRLEQATNIISDLKKEAGHFSEVSRSMKDLQDYLKSPKLRGNIGEQVLSDLIGQMFPKSGYVLQHRFSTGQIVDVAIQTQAGILPIDSKFPMENFQRIYSSTTQSDKHTAQLSFHRDVKKHLRDIAGKYILPAEHTLDFALMYIPSESVYYEIVNKNEIMDLSRELRVYPVSPTTLYANLQTILLSLEGQKMASKSAEVFTLLRAIQKDHEKLSDHFNLLSKHLTNAYNTMNNTSQTITQIGSKLDTARGLKSGLVDK
jgi:DNA recombination protein RmuC